jgi:hypothetical protein
VYSIDPKALLDPPLIQQLQIVHPRYLQLLFSKLNLTEDQLLAQQSLNLSRHFTTFPMVECFEVTAMTQVGVMIGTGVTACEYSGRPPPDTNSHHPSRPKTRKAHCPV